MTSALRPAVLGIRFLSELALLAVLAIVGVNAGLGTAANVTVAILAPVAAAVIWGAGIAPRAARRWPDPWRFCVEVALFLAATAALAAEGSPAWAIVFAVATIGIAAAVRAVAPGS
ncbi:MAG: YrdB family protein [Streptosporangiaceae bacterium]